jgi:hypothetical protein
MFRNRLVFSIPNLLFLLVMPAGAVTTAPSKDLIPAGTIIYCTMDEPNFSSKTAKIGDPILCNLGPLRSFGHSVFPRGAELSGRLQDYKNPGHFFGKGSLSLEFDRVILPNAEVMPLSAKIVSVPHQKLDANGSIHGKGHAKRDAFFWAVPVFWPIKILTLPARGPFPVLKGESRLALRLMDDVEVPLPTIAKNSVPAPPWATPRSYNGPTTDLQPASTVAHQSPTVTFTPTTESPAQPITVIALQGGSALLAREYWLDGGQLHCVSQDGAEHVVPIARLDLAETFRVNQERNVNLLLHSKGEREQ